ncbi:MAG: glucose-6-phosphate isomerase [Pigmentiphaga sp.]|uniref:glucose-6-phosphate isomerase n=1 Tax=Pigmentiphaga sp. TaxID=1977564 RepID=UPI0029AC2DDF|nr:glucose-6-phosphate isomerase [Pigmentiphaga sp.]MDX3906486.1 glucose-6-phosphate isomerase [Pigmentiphaga sp.]
MMEGAPTYLPNPVEPLAGTAAWQAFAEAARRADRSGGTLRVLEAAGLSVDLSTQAQSPELLAAGSALLAARDFDACRERLLEGGIANCTENRAAWHTALRAEEPPGRVAGRIVAERDRVRAFVRHLDAEGRFHSVVHIGIGGSDWGPKLVVSALGYAGTRRQLRFVSNIDGHAIEAGLIGLDPQHTLVVVSSKSFTTTETMHNAQCALQWLREAGIADPWSHVVAVTANPEAAQRMGVAPDRIFTFWDWAGGRYSVWSAIGLPIALALGAEALDGLLQGAAAMDEHFAQAPLEHNAPVQLALTGLANRNVFGYPSVNIAPYDARLLHLVSYLQQLEMESLGKSVDLEGRPVTLPTGPIVWGMPGTDGQHTFFQWLHQGPEGAPVDFIICREADHPYPEHHRLLVANCLAQREALLRGKPASALEAEVAAKESDPARAAWLARHKAHPGGRPSSLIVLPRLTAHAMGALLALYEHKVFVQGVVWGINPFDQWGVEYGKVLATGIAKELSGDAAGEGHDPSTAYWVGQWRGRK